MTLRVLAVDDERPALDDLARVLRAQPAVTDVDTAESGEEALHALAGEHYDAVFLDVRMPGLDGVELARVLRRFASPPALIFVSAYESAAVEAFELRALDYLLKPVVAGAGGRGARARDRPSRPTDAPDTLAVDVPGGGTRLVRRDDVLYLQAHGDYVRVVARDGRFLVRGTLGRDRAALGAARLPSRPPALPRQPAQRGRGAPAAQRHRAADPRRRRRAADRPPRGRGAATAAALMSRAARAPT